MKKLVMAISVVALTACTTLNPYTGEEETSDTAKGAGGGALLGAAIGAAADGSEGALIGALAGGLIGGGVGRYMDDQNAKLRASLEQTGVRVVQDKTNNTIRLIMPGNITFQSGSGAIRSDFYPVLTSVATVLKEYDKTSVYITGYTDNQGSYEMNQQLSEERADSVGAYLSSQGVAVSRLHMHGASYSDPIADNSTAEGRAQNRRVEIVLKPM
jgi:outer membrane protein OmpA-like peptidoglycan-associated protein